MKTGQEDMKQETGRDIPIKMLRESFPHFLPGAWQGLAHPGHRST